MLFESKERRAKDIEALRATFRKYGDEAVDILKERSEDQRLTARDRRHWRRLFKKARRNSFPGPDAYPSE